MMQSPRREPSFTPAGVIAVRAGWPRLSLEYSRWKTDVTQIDETVQGLLMVPNILPGIQDPYVPLRPIWSGFAVNTLFYAAVLWLLISGPFALRRLIRLKRGRCPACAYDLRHGEHDACPECGRLPA